MAGWAVAVRWAGRAVDGVRYLPRWAVEHLFRNRLAIGHGTPPLTEMVLRVRYCTAILFFRSLGPASAFASRPTNLSTISRHSRHFISFTAGDSEDGTDDGEPRTGWLHNTEAKYPPEPPPTGESIAAMRRILQQRMKDYKNHRILAATLHPCAENQRLVVTEHKIECPLTYPGDESPVEKVGASFNSESLETPTVGVYFTIIELVSNTEDEEFFVSLAESSLTPRQRSQMYLQRGPIDADRMFAYLQGGPGFGCSAPVSALSLASKKSSWASSVLFGDVTNLDGKSFKRVILMDQRGTGKSTPVTKQRLRKLYPDLFALDDVPKEAESAQESAQLQLARAKVSKSVKDATDYLSKFRADFIVRDMEWIKDSLVEGSRPYADEDGETTTKSQPYGASLGQSFGGFCSMTYLSTIANPPRLMLFTGGIAPAWTTAREVYDRLWLRVKERSYRYYEQYPGDVDLIKRIVRTLLKHQEDPSLPPVKLPSGGKLTARRFLSLGLALGGTPGAAMANLHSVIGSAFLDEDGDELSNAFLKRIDYEQSFDDAPLYFLLHESIYADGQESSATEWAAHSSYEDYVKSDPQFDYKQTCTSDTSPTLFFGEMVFPWFADDFDELSGDGMKLLANSLAEKSDWSQLYDENNIRAALNGKVKAASATYYDDLYVDFDIVMKVLKRGSAMDQVKVWITNEHQHSGLRDDGAGIVTKLAAMAKGAVYIPS